MNAKNARKNRQNQLGHIADRWHCSVRSVFRWVKDGAPVNDDVAMRSWLTTRKNLPAGTVSVLEAESRAVKTAFELPAIDPNTIGAPAALKRLEQFEAAAFMLLQAALQGGDPVSIKSARDSWLKCGDSLRRYDLLVEQSRRTSDEMIRRSDAEAWVQSFVYYMRVAGRRSAEALAPVVVGQGVIEIAESFTKVHWSNILTTVASLGSAKSQSRLPDWWVKAATQEMGNALNGCNETVETRRRAFEDLFSAVIRQGAKLCATKN
jgi:hypothetical protein